MIFQLFDGTAALFFAILKNIFHTNFCWMFYHFLLEISRVFLALSPENFHNIVRLLLQPHLKCNETDFEPRGNKINPKETFLFFPFRTHQRKVSQPEGKNFMTEKGENVFPTPPIEASRTRADSTFVMKKMWIFVELTRRTPVGVKLFVVQIKLSIFA